FYPEVTLIHSLLVITIVVFADKGLDMIIDRSERAGHLIAGKPTEAIRNDVVTRDFIDGSALSRSELFWQLRQRGVENLGEVDFAYLETDGGLTVFKTSEAQPGLPIVPPWEIVAPVEIRPGRGSGPAVCKRCGKVEVAQIETCSNCGYD